MKTKLLFLAFCFGCFAANAQEKDKTSKSGQLLKELSENACKCIDSIRTFDVDKKVIAGNVSDCIDKQVGAYQMGKKLMDIDLSETSGEKKNITIEINVNKESEDYREHYYEMERYLMNNCAALKEKMAQNNKVSFNSVSENPDALKYYDEAGDLTKKGDFKGAIAKYEKALKIDPKFVFALDNIGICYRRLEQYDKAIEYYEKSLQINPYGTMPLQNIAIAHMYKKDYPKAILAYERLAKIDSENPEVFYGLANVYIMFTADYEKGVDNVSKAYKIYKEHNSPYRADAEKLLGVAYREMKDSGKEARFIEILKQNGIEMK